MSRFRKKPVMIEAVQWVGSNETEIKNFCKDAVMYGDEFWITTLEGTMICSLEDWIIRGVKDEFYPCKPDIFKMTYEPA